MKIWIRIPYAALVRGKIKSSPFKWTKSRLPLMATVDLTGILQQKEPSL